jgi:hypothetical protein
MRILLQISDKAKYLLEAMQKGESPSQVVSELMNSNAAVKITGRIHLFTLLFEVGKKKFVSDPGLTCNAFDSFV